MRIRTTVLLANLLMLTAVNAELLRAQSGTSSALTGTINDATGAVVPNATVKAAEVSTGAERTARSNAEGRFVFAQVNPGVYRISVAAEGFGQAESQPSK
ncbi:MAG: carboxypeptidase-like regulatory domain-containing protein, partial [Terracidiphilus sp.]